MLTFIQKKVKGLWSNEQGLGMLEIILIIAVIVILAGIFRKELSDIIQTLLGKAKENSLNFMKEK